MRASSRSCNASPRTRPRPPRSRWHGCWRRSPGSSRFRGPESFRDSKKTWPQPTLILSVDDQREIRASASAIDIHGARLPESVLKWTNGGDISAMTRRQALVAIGLVVLGTMTFGQQTGVPQPRMRPSPRVGPARTNRGGNVPLPATRNANGARRLHGQPVCGTAGAAHEVYAPNGDLFVSSPTTNTITVSRDTNLDGTFESREVFAQGTVPPARGGDGGARVGGARPGGPPAVLRPPLPSIPRSTGRSSVRTHRHTPPPPFRNPGPGTIAAPFGLAFHGGYLYVNGEHGVARPVSLLARRPDGAGRAREAPRLSAGRPHHSQRRLQPRRYEDVRCRRFRLEQHGRRRLPACRDPRVQSRWVGLSRLCIRHPQPVGLAWQPGTDTLWTAVNERDNLGDDLVPDYATSVRDGGFYGWPYSYIGQHYDPRCPGCVSRSGESARSCPACCSRRMRRRSASRSTATPSSRPGIGMAGSSPSTAHGTVQRPAATRSSSSR